MPNWHKGELERRLTDPTPERIAWADVKSRFFPSQ